MTVLGYAGSLRTLSCAVATILGIAGGTLPAQAQDAGGGLEEVVVTGT